MWLWVKKGFFKKLIERFDGCEVKVMWVFGGSVLG